MELTYRKNDKIIDFILVLCNMKTTFNVTRSDYVYCVNTIIIFKYENVLNFYFRHKMLRLLGTFFLEKYRLLCSRATSDKVPNLKTLIEINNK